ncbi:putative nitrogen fixation protein NifT [Magnetospirillum aberrantis]|uniref:Putative nitrogen fixation protein NifT n=1 Tax=Magnetospirillum aberrantis SpK TaxID=908842 RepID=A0A7C9US91_9PROT|nr:putative nitrogen fixation protein NifT [Magnetospirillum aberrantis]NFV79148.1 putative nitrogen fixation protein NifT [Magnetospirillum aberrantis SpK]
MKVTLRKVADYYEIYVPKKDLEEKIVAMEGDSPWGGIVTISNGWRFQMPEMPADTPLPITVDARKLGDED